MCDTMMSHAVKIFTQFCQWQWAYDGSII